MDEQRDLRPRTEPLQRRAHLTRHRILTAATTVFAQYGYTAGTTNRIADHAGVSIGSLYRYFPNKDAILAALLDLHIDRSMGALASARTTPAAPLATTVRALLHAWRGRTLENLCLLRAMAEQAPRSSGLVAGLRAYEKDRIRRLGILLGSHPEVRVKDIHMAAAMVVSCLDLTGRELFGDSLDAARFERELAVMVTGYLTADSTEALPRGS